MRSGPLDHDALIGRLAAQLRPVRRMPHPALLAAAWVAVALAVGLALASMADLEALRARLMFVPDMWLAAAGSAATALLAALAAFQSTAPDRSPYWALLPVPAAALWIGASGMGCMRGWLVPGTHDPDMPEMRICMVFIIGLSLPLSALLVVLLRRGCSLNPGRTAVLGGLAAAAAAATLLNLFHPYDAAVSDLVGHAFAVAIVVLANRLWGGRILARNGA